MVQYWKINETTVAFDDPENEVAGIATAEDVTGRWSAYLLWLADDNTPAQYELPT